MRSLGVDHLCREVGYHMKSILVRFTKREYAEQFASGRLSLSSLSTFWQLPTTEVLKNGATEEQLDCSEGVGYELPAKKFEELLSGESSALKGHIIHDIRFRFEAYGYCNLLCFYRIDIRDRALTSIINASLINESVPNRVLAPSPIPRIIHAPSKEMFTFGDTAILIRDEEAFVKKVLPALKRQGRACIIGDVRYYQKSIRPNISSNVNSITLLSTEHPSALLNALDYIGERKNAHSYGSMDKLIRYSNQREWRICWLPEQLNFERKEVEVGDLHDIVELIPSQKLYSRLLELYPGYCIGETTETRLVRYGTKYSEFKQLVETLDGKGRLMLDIG